MLYSIDRIVEESLVLLGDDGSCVHLPVKEVAFTPKEGDVLKKIDGTWLKDEAETDRRREETRNLLITLWED